MKERQHDEMSIILSQFDGVGNSLPCRYVIRVGDPLQRLDDKTWIILFPADGSKGGKLTFMQKEKTL